MTFSPSSQRSPTLAVVFLAGLVASGLAAAPVDAATANRIIARVNDRIATLYDYEIRLEDAMRRVRDMPEDPTGRAEFLDQLARDVMRDLFEELLITSRADQLGITVTAIEVSESIARMRESNGLTDEQQFRAALAQSGMTPEVLRAQFEQQLRSQRVIGREVYSAVQLEEEDLRRYYRDHIEEFRQPEQVKVREVVVLDETGVSPSAASTADALVAELRAGRALDEVMAAQPAGILSPVIEVGWVESGDLDPALEDAVWSLPAGGWSEPTRGRGGVHVAQVVERRESVVPSFKDVEQEIRRREERARLDERMVEYLADLEKKAYLYLDPPPQAAGFRGSSGETPINVEFPFVAPDGASGDASSEAAGAGAAGEDAESESAEEAEIEQDLDEIEESAPEDAPAPDTPR